MTVAGSPSQEAFSNDHWQSLLKQTQRYAHDQVNRFRWRLAPGGVLPDGFDADTLAAQVVAEALQCFHLRREAIWFR